MDWTKINHSLSRSPEVHNLTHLLKIKINHALGIATRWLCWIDENTTDGVTRMLPEQVDDELNEPGSGLALCKIGWAVLDEDGCLVATNFDLHCGRSAKQRALDARRQRNHRLKIAAAEPQYQAVTPPPPAPVTPVSRTERDKIVTRKEKKKEDIINKGELSTTVYQAAPVVQSPPPPINGREPAGFGRWLQSLAPAIPMLKRLNLDAPLPRPVETEARQACRLVPLDPGTCLQLQRYYAAAKVPTYRPDSLEHFFRDLPDVLQHAANWCRDDDIRRRKQAATARRLAAEHTPPPPPDHHHTLSDAEAAAQIAAMRSELRP